MAYVPQLVPDSRLLPANSRLEASYSAAQVAGPGIGALLVSLFRAPLALIADALSFLFSALMLSTIREPGSGCC